MRKEIYETPEMEITRFEAEDIIRTSGIKYDDNETEIAPWN